MESPIVNDKKGSAVDGRILHTDACYQGWLWRKSRDKKSFFTCAFLCVTLAQICCGLQNHIDRRNLLKQDFDDVSDSELDKVDHGASIYGCMCVRVSVCVCVCSFFKLFAWCNG